MDSIGFIGGGNMAEALIKGLIKAGVCKPADIIVSDVSQQRLTHLAKEYAVKTAGDNKAAASKADIVVLSIKPQKAAEVLQDIKGSIKSGTLVVSIMAGKKISSITGTLGDVPVVRVMPNTPALIGEGMSALFANKKAEKLLDKAARLFSAVGRTVIVESEDLMDAVTAISGSGPAYFFLFMEHLYAAAVKLGLSEEQAGQLVLQTAKGAALLAAEAAGKGKTAEQLRHDVTSPGGTTQKAIEIFEGRGLKQIIADAIEAAYKRSQELSK